MAPVRNAHLTRPICRQQKPGRDAVHGDVIHGPVADLVTKDHPPWTREDSVCLSCVNHVRAQYARSRPT